MVCGWPLHFAAPLAANSDSTAGGSPAEDTLVFLSTDNLSELVQKHAKKPDDPSA